LIARASAMISSTSVFVYGVSASSGELCSNARRSPSDMFAMNNLPMLVQCSGRGSPSGAT
jgi:hypothetical protein